MRVKKLNVCSLNVVSRSKKKLNVIGNFGGKKGKGYGVDNWLWDDGGNMLWDNESVVLTDKTE